LIDVAGIKIVNQSDDKASVGQIDSASVVVLVKDRFLTKP
jgi:hypothetical protein